MKLAQMEDIEKYRKDKYDLSGIEAGMAGELESSGEGPVYRKHSVSTICRPEFLPLDTYGSVHTEQRLLL